MRSPTTSLNENTSPGAITVPSMKSAIRCTLWMRFDDDSPICVVYETSFRRIPSAFAFAVVRSAVAVAELELARRGFRAPPSSTAAVSCRGSTSCPGRDGTTRTAIACDDELRVVRAHDPAAEARPDRPCEQRLAEPDGERCARA